VQVIVKDFKEIEKIKQREMDITKERICKFNARAKVILTAKGFEAGVICAICFDKDCSGH